MFKISLIPSKEKMCPLGDYFSHSPRCHWHCPLEPWDLITHKHNVPLHATSISRFLRLQASSSKGGKLCRLCDSRRRLKGVFRHWKMIKIPCNLELFRDNVIVIRRAVDHANFPCDEIPIIGSYLSLERSLSLPLRHYRPQGHWL